MVIFINFNVLLFGAPAARFVTVLVVLSMNFHVNLTPTLKPPLIPDCELRNPGPWHKTAKSPNNQALWRSNPRRSPPGRKNNIPSRDGLEPLGFALARTTVLPAPEPGKDALKFWGILSLGHMITHIYRELM